MLLEVSYLWVLVGERVGVHVEVWMSSTCVSGL